MDPISKKKEVASIEKALIEMTGSACCNQPPAQPYFVDTEEDIIAEECVPVPEIKTPNLYLDLDVHIETAAKLSCRTLSGLIVAGATTWEERARQRKAIVTYINVEEAPETLAKALEERASLITPRDTLSLKPRHEKRDYELRVILDYPFDGPAAFTVAIPNVYDSVAVGELVWAIGQAYQYVYADPAKYRIFGHALGDLVIEGIHFDTPSAVVYPDVGS